VLHGAEMQHPHRGSQRLSDSPSSCRRPSCRRTVTAFGLSSCLCKRGLPLDAVSDDVQQPRPLGMWSGSPGLTGSQVYRAGSVAESPSIPVSQALRSAQWSEVFAAMGLAPAAARALARPGVFGLDAVAEPVRAGRRARLVLERGGEPDGVGGLGVAVRLVAVAQVLGQVLGEVADAPAGIPGSGEHALGVEPRAEPRHMQRLVIVPDGVEGLVPGREHLAGLRVEVGAGVLIPHRQAVAVVLDDFGGGPPDLVVGGGDDLAELGAGDGAADGDVDVRGEAPLGFDGGEVLQVIADVAAQVLDEPVNSAAKCSASRAAR